MKTNVNLGYTIAPVTHTYRKPFKDQVLWWLWIGNKRVHAFSTRKDAMRGARVLARRWPAPINVIA